MAEPDRVRPSPEDLLERAAEEEPPAGRARLKVFFGAAPGVGKTYAMLQEAQVRRQRGEDVVVGWLETHGRKETEALARGLEIVPPRQVEHRGLALEEMDLEQVIARAPALVLVDELAHTNAPGSRHARRWQDVEELLGAGIDVFTTVNVQHVESLRDVVAQITGVTVRETIPDQILERADEIELVDLPPEELLRRLEEGKVYVPEQARLAMDRFFQKGHLIALRELSLRRTAERVDEQADAWKRQHGVARPWGTRDRILVSVSAAPSSEDLVRVAGRMAARLKAPWIALSVETRAFPHLPEEDRARLGAHLLLAKRLGAEVLVVRGERVAEEILAVARSRDVTRIVLGKPAPRGLLARLRPSLVDTVLRGSGSMDVHVTSAVPPPPPRKAKRRKLSEAGWAGLSWALLAVGIATGVGWLARAWFGFQLADLAMVYVLAVLAASAKLSRRDSLATAVLSVATLDFFFTEPYFTFAVHDVRQVTTFGVLLVVGLVVSAFATRTRDQAREARERERRTLALYEVSSALSTERDPAGIASVVVAHLRRGLGTGAIMYRAGPRGGLTLVAEGSDGALAGPRERAVAQWVLTFGAAAGRDTDTLPAAEGLYLPLVTRGGRQGVLGIRLVERGKALAPSQRQGLEAIAALAAGALERAALAEEAEEAALAVETERTRNVLLAAVSHDLRTPLSSILGAADALLDPQTTLTEDVRSGLVRSIRDTADWLARFVTDLLSLARIGAEGFVLQRDWYPVEELVASALDRVRPLLGDRRVAQELPEHPLLVHVDGVLLEQALVNLLENAARHTPPGTPIDVRARALPGECVIEVLDRGPGLPEDGAVRLFERFYRRSDARGTQGTGLGLAICRAIAVAHGGSCEAENREAGGARFRLRIPRAADTEPEAGKAHEGGAGPAGAQTGP
ncbi:MAG: ATP-binding protein [Planctomycetota bacterium]